MLEKQIDVWGVVQVRTGRLAGIFETQTEALKQMRQLSPAYIVCFANGLPQKDAAFWGMKSGRTPHPVPVVTQH